MWQGLLNIEEMTDRRIRRENGDMVGVTWGKCLVELLGNHTDFCNLIVTGLP